MTRDFYTVIPLIRIHADAEAPRECCGIVVEKRDGALQYVPCRNLARAKDQFVIDPKDAAQAEDIGQPVAYAHSHVFEPPTPSAADRESMARSGLPWIIVNHPEGSFTINSAAPYVAPLIGRKFVHGVHDCYGIVRDYYLTELGIVLNDYPRLWGWWERTDGPDLYRDNFAREGFNAIHEGALDAPALRLLRLHDVLLMRIRTPRDNHAAVYVGNNVILHHLIDQLSCRAVFDGFYQRRTTAILRHRSFIGRD
ncbi:C40 family peptidase [Paraburkholderia unamae]|uniref:C40 family peptidase n=1 Tax=Paraburkholderia unamae TaxID=219649 RepID=A0ACC6RQN2_9BURK